MPQSFGDIWRKVRLYAPAVPALLVQSMVRDTFRDFCEQRSEWSFLRGEGEFRLNPFKSGTAILTQGSPTVTSTGGAGGITFATADVGRQFRTGSSGPPLTIIAVSLAGNTSATLERNWEGAASASATVTVSDLYATCPADFAHFVAVVDPQNNRLVRIFVTEQELNAADPGRFNTGIPWALFNYRLSSLTATLDRVQYEWWPYYEGSAAIRFPFYYIKRPAELTDDSTFQGPLRDRADLIELGARARVAQWPGTEEHRNPYFNLNLAAQLKQQYDYGVGLLEVRDEEMYMTWLQDQWWARYSVEGYGIGPIDAAYMQSHE